MNCEQEKEWAVILFTNIFKSRDTKAEQKPITAYCAENGTQA